MGNKRKIGDIALDLLLIAGVMTAGLYLAQNIVHPILSNIVDPDKEKHEQTRRQAKAHLERLNRPGIVGKDGDELEPGRRDFVLNEFESLVALEMVAPQDIHVRFQVRAVFSLARKMQPSIIFIDEIDAVLGRRRSGEHEASGMVKAEFMTLWDGLTSANESGLPAQILVLGATNRMHDIDEAILRRMPKKFPVPLPGLAQRQRILQLLLQDTKKDPLDLDLDYVSHITAGMSGSDIKEACREAAMAPVREYLKSHGQDRRQIASASSKDFRGIRTGDFSVNIYSQQPQDCTFSRSEANKETQ
ncbi:hypothetical protein CDD80_977 [Ophiocordyceps camponoti-rufipedis]|uniref:AAA+ ATPase domain-containing protein n=1 Tax=Ophiocordyceps camponoti-rufipedis TaxID=2004952 RepID=A0A2C5XN14_9HYPO|nr:hypothetical protein CDD80_977 [Ophiocordyceps camponoti-rufipedis]